MSPEELASTFEGHASSCDRNAAYHRNAAGKAAHDARQDHHDLAVANEAKAETLRWAAARTREALTDVAKLMAQVDHYAVISEDRWVVEHSVQCRLARLMASCEYTVWAIEHLSGSRLHPAGRFVMRLDEHTMALVPA